MARTLEKLRSLNMNFANLSYETKECGRLIDPMLFTWNEDNRILFEEIDRLQRELDVINDELERYKSHADDHKFD